MIGEGASYRFGPFLLEREAYRLTRDGRHVVMPPKVTDLLFLLVSRAGVLVTKDDILTALWPDVAVTDNALTQTVSELRQALGDVAGSPTYLQTVPRKGYRFVADVSPGPDSREHGAVSSARPGAIAVLAFTNVNADESLGWLGTGLAETLAGDLGAVAGLRVIDPAMAASLAQAPSAEAARAAGVDLAVVGSFQRAGTRVRITARVIDARTGEAKVHAKADGDLDDVFALQDSIARQVIAELRLTLTPPALSRARVRETPSLEAYRALTEGRLLLETLDPAQIAAATTCFERALAIEPRYALAHCGLAHARFWRYQATRARVDRSNRDLDRAIEHASQAVEIDPDLAEAHASLGLCLASAGRTVEAVAAGRRAVTLEPATWRHQFRLGIAAWGDDRLDALEAVVAQFPMLAYAHFGLAMVHVARGDLTAARHVLDRARAAGPPDSAGATRFPASGVLWLAGLVEFAAGRLDEAERLYQAELRATGSRLFADEYLANAFEGLGALRLASGDPTRAVATYDEALERLPGRPTSLIGQAAALAALGARDRAAACRAEAQQTIDAWARAGRSADAGMAAACLEASSARLDRAVDALDALLAREPPGPAGWLIPVEPLLSAARARPPFRRVLGRLRERAGLNWLSGRPGRIR